MAPRLLLRLCPCVRPHVFSKTRGINGRSVRAICKCKHLPLRRNPCWDQQLGSLPTSAREGDSGGDALNAVCAVSPVAAYDWERLCLAVYDWFIMISVVTGMHAACWRKRRVRRRATAVTLRALTPPTGSSSAQTPEQILSFPLHKNRTFDPL